MRLFYWLPRVLGLAFAGFTSIFALDVFGDHRGFWPVLLALALHLIPTGMILVLLALAWRWEWIGVVSFAGLALCYLVAFGGRFHWSVYACIAGPLLLIALLFLVSWRLHTKTHLNTPATSAA
jgi:hypothetical protein